MLARSLTVLFLAMSLGTAQDPPAPEPVNTAITPVPREGAWMLRQEKIVAAVKANAAACDLVFVGDSITQGWENAGHKVWEERYGARRALNLGISGDRTEHVLWRLDHDNLTGITPKVAVVMIGTNNFGQHPSTPKEVLAGVRAVVTSILNRSPTTKVLLLGIFPRGDKFNDMRGNILQVNQALARLDDGSRIRFLDIGSVFIEDDGTISKSIMPDFLHLSEDGYRRWADAIEPTLAQLLAD